MILSKDVNIESTKSEGEAKIEDEQYGKPNQQCQKHEKVIAKLRLKLKRWKKKIREIKQQKKIKTTKIPAKQVN